MASNDKVIEFTVFGQLQSMKNSRQPLKNSRRMIMSKPARKFAEDFALQVALLPGSLKQSIGSKSEPLKATVHVYYPTWRQDLDCALVYDLLQACGIVSNDRWIREKHERATVSPEPRVYVRIEKL